MFLERRHQRHHDEYKDRLLVRFVILCAGDKWVH